MDKPEGYQLEDLTLQHFYLLKEIVNAGVIDEDESRRLFEEGIRSLPERARRILLPIDKDVYNALTDAVGKHNKITVYRDQNGKRYIGSENIYRH